MVAGWDLYKSSSGTLCYHKCTCCGLVCSNHCHYVSRFLLHSRRIRASVWHIISADVHPATNALLAASPVSSAVIKSVTVQSAIVTMLRYNVPCSALLCWIGGNQTNWAQMTLARCLCRQLPSIAHASQGCLTGCSNRNWLRTACRNKNFTRASSSLCECTTVFAV